MGELPRTSGPVAAEQSHPGASLRLWLAMGAGAVVGIAAEALSFGFADPQGWVPDLLVGWACMGFGLLVIESRPESRIGLILTGAGFAWFIFNFSLPLTVLAVVATQLALTHRAMLLHAALTLPGGRFAGWAQPAVIVIVYVAWSIPATAGIPIATILLGALVVAAAGWQLLTAAPPARRVRLVGLAATVLLSGAFALASVVHAAVPAGEADRAVLLVDQAIIVVVAGALAVATLLPRLRVGRITDLLVQASWSRSGIVRDTLADALGDPSLEIGYWHGASERYLDAAGEAVTLPSPGGERTTLRVDLDNRPAALLVHDPAALESSALTDAVRTTTVLASANARLRGDVLDQLAEVRASRRRLVLAEDAELGRLERRVDRGPLQRSRDLSASLTRIGAAATSHGTVAVAERVRRAREALARASGELETLARGLHPADVTAHGLAPALRALTDRSPLPVQLTCEVAALPEPVALAIYYACAEAITNVVKHAKASAVGVRVWSDGSRVYLLVTDDGAGGADPGAGSGLRGVRDRFEALDGSVHLKSNPGSGTRLLAQVPL